MQDRLARGLVLELDRFAGDGDDLAGQVVRCVARRNDLQADHGALRTADQLDHFIQAPADHVDHFLVTLGNTNDLVGRRNLLGLVGRARWHEAYDLDLVVVALQHGADALKGQAHVDVEVFRAIWRQIVGVRIVGHRESVDVGLEDILGTGLIQARQLVLVALDQQFLDRLGVLAGDLQAQYLVLDAFAPEVVEFGGALEPRSIPCDRSAGSRGY